MKAKNLDKKFDEGKDISKYFDLSKIRHPKQEQKRVNVDFPIWMIHSLDKEAHRLGVPRQSIIKVWVAERLEKKNEIITKSMDWTGTQSIFQLFLPVISGVRINSA